MKTKITRHLARSILCLCPEMIGAAEDSPEGAYNVFAGLLHDAFDPSSHALTLTLDTPRLTLGVLYRAKQYLQSISKLWAPIHAPATLPQTTLRALIFWIEQTQEERRAELRGQCPSCAGVGQCTRCDGGLIVWWGTGKGECPHCEGCGQCDICDGSGFGLEELEGAK